MDPGIVSSTGSIQFMERAAVEPPFFVCACKGIMAIYGEKYLKPSLSPQNGLFSRLS
jgi:hypothetical protein